MSQYQDDEQDPEPEERETLRDLRSAADEGRKAKRELAFVKAGIDTDTPLGKMFATAYDGDLTRDAIAEEWEKIAPAPAVDQAPTPAEQLESEPTPEDRYAHQAAQDRARRAIASTPAEPVQEPTIDPLKAGYDAFHDNMRNGMSREQAAKPVLEAIIGGAANGDQRFVWNGEWTDQEMVEGRVTRS
jgi:hypothetical protein